MNRDNNDSNKKKPSMKPWVVLGIISFIGMVVTSDGEYAFPFFYCGLSVACIGIIVVFWIRVAKATKKAVNKTTDFVYDIGAAVHDVATNSSNNGSYDLLDFTKGYSNIEYVIRVRVVPVLASYFFKRALIDIRKNTNEINEYSSYMVNTLLKNGANLANATAYFKEVIDLVYSNVIPDFELRSRLFSYLCDNCSRDVYIEIIIPSLLLFTNSINGCFCLTLTDFFKGLGLSTSDITEGFINGGYKETVMNFPSKSHYTIADYKDLFDFTDSPIDQLYSLDGVYTHMNYCRVVPIIAYYSSRQGNMDLLGKDKDTVETYIHALKNRENPFPNDSIETFVNETLRECSLLSNDKEPEMMSKLSDYLNILNTVVLREIIQYCFHLVKHINNSSCTFIYDITSHRVSVDEINECIKDAGFESFTFVPETKEETKNESEYLNILGLVPGATLEEIKNAYRKLSMKFHPDKIAGKELDEEFIRYAEKRFREITEAYEFLKSKFDSSSDISPSAEHTFTNI